jgi:hypothetical protein
MSVAVLRNSWNDLLYSSSDQGFYWGYLLLLTNETVQAAVFDGFDYGSTPLMFSVTELHFDNDCSSSPCW